MNKLGHSFNFIHFFHSFLVSSEFDASPEVWGGAKTEIELDNDEDRETEALVSELNAMALFKDIESSFEICDAEGEMDEVITEKTNSYYERCLLS